MNTHLLNRLPPAGYREQQTQRVATRWHKGDRTQLFSAMIFRLGREWLALPAGLCQQVLSPLPAHRLPHRSNSTLLGIINVRGQLLLKVSLFEILGVSPQQAANSERSVDSKTVDSKTDKESMKAYPRMLVIEKQSEDGEVDSWVFDVDELHGIHAVAFSQLSPAAPGVSTVAHPCIRDVFAWQNQQVSFLDDVRLFEALRQQAL